jgi:glycerol-3-phosphate acyltransferase PlsY
VMTSSAMPAALILLGYLLGSIPFGFLLVRRVAGVDLRDRGSGNLGAANVLRTAGSTAGVLVALADIGKGFAAVAVAERARLNPAMCTAVGVAAVVGHLYPAWLQFRGGKGVATACGAFWLLAPTATGVALLLFLATVRLTRYVSLGSLMATLVLGPAAYVSGAPRPVVIGAFLTGVLVVGRHRSNLARLRAGTERRLGQRA